MHPRSEDSTTEQHGSAGGGARAFVVVVMGVAGSGKTTIGSALAAAMGASFVDADALHPQANIAKMHAGVPLDDADRAPWLERVRAVIEEALIKGSRLVVACSALRDRYRHALARDKEPIAFVLLDAPKSVLAARLAARSGHFFDPSLLDSQLETLERPEGAVVVDATQPVEEVATRILTELPIPQISP